MVGVHQMTGAPNFQIALIWFLEQPSVVLLSIGTLTAFTVVIACVFLLKKWGGYN
jgi:hypothetical protein